MARRRAAARLVGDEMLVWRKGGGEGGGHEGGESLRRSMFSVIIKTLETVFY